MVVFPRQRRIQSASTCGFRVTVVGGDKSHFAFFSSHSVGNVNLSAVVSEEDLPHDRHLFFFLARNPSGDYAPR
jgi:hypothetical protein